MNLFSLLKLGNATVREGIQTVTALGTTIADAAPIPREAVIVLVSGADAAVGVKLPVGIPGQFIIIKNLDNAVLKVYCDGFMNVTLGVTAFAMAAYVPNLFYCRAYNYWHSFPYLGS